MGLINQRVNTRFESSTEHSLPVQFGNPFPHRQFLWHFGYRVGGNVARGKEMMDRALVACWNGQSVGM
jgi:hypothetical protein